MIQELGKHKYRFIVSVGSDKTRKRYCKTIEHTGGKKELKRLYQQFEDECKERPDSDITVRELVEAYIAHCKLMGRKATTIRGYDTAAERLYALLGDTLARDCTTGRIEKKIAVMVDNGLSAKTIKNTINLLSAAYRHSIKVGQLAENPCDRLTLPKGEPRDIRILYLDEIPKFLEAIADEEIDNRVAFMLALFMGLRRSEILGLKESDVDIVNGLLNVHNTRHRVDGENVEQTTKTKRSTRVLAIPDVLLIELAKLLESHRQFPYEKTDYLIWDFGEPINPQTLASRLVRLEAEKGLPHVTLHGLRHTYASLLHSQGVDMANISAELGHSNLTTTANLYTHRFGSATNASRGIANTIDSVAKNSAKFLPNEENEKPSER